MIEVRFFATLRENRGKIVFIEKEGIETAFDILNKYEIDRKDVAILLINGRHKKPEDAINDEDIVAIFPPVGGG